MTCPNCSGLIDLDEDELDEGDPVTCDECGTELLVAGVHPLELELAGAEDEEDEEAEDFDEKDEDEETDEEFEEEDEEEDEWS